MPSLTLEALRERLKQKQPGAVHLFYGTDVRLMDRMVEAVEAVVDEADRPFAVDRIHAGEPGGSPVDIVAAASNMPMLGERRVVIVLRAERLLKPKRAGKAVEENDDDGAALEADESPQALDMSPLEAYLDAPAPFSTLVFVASEIDKARRLTKRILEHALVTKFDGGEGGEGAGEARKNLGNVLRGILLREGKSIEREAAVMLVSRAGGDISKLRDDVERLVLYVGDRKRITEDDVLAVSAEHQSVDSDWALPNALADGDAARALTELMRRLDRGDSVHAVLGQLRWWVSNKLAQTNEARATAAIDALLRTDLALKSSGGDQRVLMDRLVVELAGTRAAGRRPPPFAGRRY